MTDPSFDEERELRSALGTLLADEPPPAWAVTDDVARGRTHLARRRARLGGGIALIAVLALVVGLVGPWRSVDRTNPLPLGSATPTPVPSGASAAVADYLASVGWPVTSTKLTIDVEDGSIVSTTYAVRSATTEGMTAQLTVRSYNSPPPAGSTTGVAGFRVGSALQRCGAACGHGKVMMLSCAVSGCADAVAYAWVERATADFAVGELLVEQRWSDGTQLEAVVSTRWCSPCAAQPSQPGFVSGLGTIPSFLSSEQAGRALALTGKPALRGAPTPVPSTGPSTVNAETPNPYYVAHNPDRAWAHDVLDAASTYVAQQGATASGPGGDGLSLGLARGIERAWLEIGYATTTTDAPECLGRPNCTVLQPWTSARGGTVEVALTETTIAPGTVSAAMRGPSYQLLVRSGHRLVRLEEGTTFGTLLNGDVQGFVLSADQLLGAAELLSFPPPSPTPSVS